MEEPVVDYEPREDGPQMVMEPDAGEAVFMGQGSGRKKRQKVQAKMKQNRFANRAKLVKKAPIKFSKASQLEKIDELVSVEENLTPNARYNKGV